MSGRRNGGLHRMGLDVDSEQKKKNNTKHDRQTVNPDLSKLFRFFLVSSISFYQFPSPELCQNRQHMKLIKLMTFELDERIIKPLSILNASDIEKIWTISKSLHFCKNAI